MTAPWWQKGIVYQIYPRSFQDTNHDGIGDLAGITRRLDYLKWLGVDAVWISPIFPSPMKDFGYDISDYTDIDPRFGSLKDFDALLAAAHARDLKVILDFVPNHTSDEHPWFRESRASRGSPKRDWYLWCDAGPGGGPPNNWFSAFGGSAWEWDETTQQYYYHAFLKEQPDLNWRNPEVREAMLGMMRFWLERGVDGFRVDVIWHMIKDDLYRDNPPDPAWLATGSEHQSLLALYNTDRPEVHDIISSMRELTERYHERLLIGEIYLAVDRLVTYYGKSGTGVHLPFNFQLLHIDWRAPVLAQVIDSYERSLPAGAWPNWVLGNHDNARIATKLGRAQARVAAMLLLTLRGTPTIYYGEELGLENVAIAADQVRDPYELRVPGRGHGRDPERTPMAWDASLHGGFSSARPWLPLHDDYRSRNVSVERETGESMLQLYRRLIELRREETALALGSYVTVSATENVLCYRREDGGRRFVVALNLSARPERLSLGGGVLEGEIVLSTTLQRAGEGVEGTLELGADEGVVISSRV